MNLLAKKIRNILRIIKKPLIRKEDFWIKNIPEIDEENKALIESIGEHSLTPLIRRWTLIKSLHYINKKNLIGDIVECGIWRGGNLFLAKKIQDKYLKGFKRKFYGFDTFEGMPKPSYHDGIKINEVYQSFKNRNEPWTKASLGDVKNSSEFFFSNVDDFSFIKGMVEDTLKDKKNLPNKISLLRLDTDLYESTKIELNILYPLLVEKGVLIIDDYGDFQGCRKAVDEYFLDKNVLMISVDKSCRVIVKN
jgi:O-methyltransferase